MNSVIKDIDISASNPVILCPISDTHVGHASFDQEYFANSVKWIKDNGAYVILLGDLIDAIPTQDRRFENTSIAKEFLPHLDNLHHEQTTSVIKMLRPIKDQIIAMLSGNHECKLRTSFSYDATKVISDALGIARISDPGYVILKFRRSKTSVLQKNILCTHGGILGGRKRGGKVNNLEDTLSSFEFDIVMAGHSHDAWTSKRYRISPNSKGVLSHDKKLFINGGSFLNTYNLNDVNDDWTSRKMFSPGIPNMMRVDFYLKEKNRKNYIDVHVRE
jgi:predicted phosphodiesterase